MPSAHAIGCGQSEELKQVEGILTHSTWWIVFMKESHNPFLLYLWVSSEVGGTDALLLVVDHVAESVKAAGPLDAAGVAATSLVTHLTRLAVSVRGARAYNIERLEPLNLIYIFPIGFWVFFNLY